MKKIIFANLIKNMLILFVFIVLILSVGCSGSSDNPVLEIQRGSISGVVLDQNKIAVQGAVVTSHRSLYKAETDEMGRFTFTSLDVGRHNLTVERGGYYLGSASVELGYGQTLYDVSIKVEGMKKMLSATVAVKEKTRVVIDVACHESMRVSATYRELGNMPITTEPTVEMSTGHRIVLSNLYPDAVYYYSVSGKTADGRNFTTDMTSFKTVSLYDVEGPPPSPVNFVISQTLYGPSLSWEYKGDDPIKGFRIYRSENGGKMVLLREERDVFSSQTSLLDDTVFPGRYYSYNLYAVDCEGNLSENPAKASFVPAGKISENIVWKKEWSPINLEGDMTVPSRYTLCIEPGTVVRFLADTNIGSGFKNGVCEFVVEGTLIAKGTEAEPIKFLSQSSTPQKDDWDGIRFLAGKDEDVSELEHIVISGANTGLKIYGGNISLGSYAARYCKTGLAMVTASGTVISDLDIKDCEVGIKIEGTYNCYISSVRVESCNLAAEFNYNTGLRFNNFDLRKCISAGIQSSDRSKTILRRGVLHSIAKGLAIGGEGCDVQFLTIDASRGIVLEGATNAVIQNNIIVNLNNMGSGNGIEDMENSGKAFPYNNIYGFKTATVNCTQFGAPVYNIDPLFEGQKPLEYDYHLRSTSPLLTVASNNGQIGAYGSE